MNRAERRRIRKTSGYRSILKQSSKKAVDDLERMFRNKWDNDETLNDGQEDEWDGEEDEIYND